MKKQTFNNVWEAIFPEDPEGARLEALAEQRKHITRHDQMPPNSLLYLEDGIVVKFLGMDGLYSHCLTSKNHRCGFYGGMPVEVYKDGFRVGVA